MVIQETDIFDVFIYSYISTSCNLIQLFSRMSLFIPWFQVHSCFSIKQRCFYLFFAAERGYVVCGWAGTKTRSTRWRHSPSTWCAKQQKIPNSSEVPFTAHLFRRLFETYCKSPLLFYITNWNCYCNVINLCVLIVVFSPSGKSPSKLATFQTEMAGIYSLIKIFRSSP